MSKFYRLVIGLLLMTGAAFAQGGYVNRKAPDWFCQFPATTYIVGTYAATGTPLSPTQPIYSDKGLTSSISQASPITLPSSCYVTFWAAPGVYQIQYNSGSTGPGAFTEYVMVPADGNVVTNGQTDFYKFVPAQTACVSSVSGNSTGTNGNTTAGASGLPVVQAQTSNVGTNTHTYTCHIPLDSRTTSGKGISISDVTFLYGVQTTGLGTQVNVLASGTFNGSQVFSSISYPAAGASETPSTVTPARADSGSMVVTPAVASFNVATTTAGAFYSAKFAPAAAIAVNTDVQEMLFTVSLLNTATSATITNTPGFFVHYKSQTN